MANATLSKDEKMIQQIYQQQLDAILFSVNPYTDKWILSTNRHYRMCENNLKNIFQVLPQYRTP